MSRIRRRSIAIVIAATALATGAVGTNGANGAPTADDVAPAVAAEASLAVRSARVAATPDFPDPGFVRLRNARAGTNNYYLFATGPGFPVIESKTAIGGYGASSPSMDLKPAWARDLLPQLWAPHVVSRTTGDLPTDITYLMFCNARHSGEGKGQKGNKDKHCIGVAEASSPRGLFVPRDKALLCPPAPIPGVEEYDEVLDPSIYSESGVTYLVYKLGDNYAGLEEGTNKDLGTKRYSILAQPLHVSLTKLGDVAPLTLLPESKTTGTNAEAPSVVRAGSRTHMFVSRNHYETLDYKTESWSSASIRGLSTSTGRDVEGLGLFESPGLFGPGGAEVIKRNGTLFIAFHSHHDSTPDVPNEHRLAYTGKLTRVGDQFSLAE